MTQAVQRIEMGERGLQISSFEDLYRFAKCVQASGLAPKGLDTPEKIVIAIQFGMEFNLSPMQALRAVVVVNGKASLMGDMALALVRASGKMKSLKVETAPGESCSITTTRADEPTPRTTTFTKGQAVKAGLWGKAGPWSQYPDRMLYYRALGFHLRDVFGDVLCGAATFEEVRDYDDGAQVKVVVESTARTAPEPQELDPLLEAPPTVHAVVEALTPEPVAVVDQPAPQEESPFVADASPEPAPAIETPITLGEQLAQKAADRWAGHGATVESATAYLVRRVKKDPGYSTFEDIKEMDQAIYDRLLKAMNAGSFDANFAAKK